MISNPLWAETGTSTSKPPTLTALPQYLISQGYNTVGTGKIFHPSSAIKKIDPVLWNLPYMEPESSDYANGLGKPSNGQYQKPETNSAEKKVTVNEFAMSHFEIGWMS